MTSHLDGEGINAMLPGKSSKLQVKSNRTTNRHRWLGREYSGAWENSGEGTRQNSAVTSGEGTLECKWKNNITYCFSSWTQSKIPAGCNCLLKTQHCANTKVDVYGVTPARCRKVNWRGYLFCYGEKLLIEASVNGGRNYNGPKVAKFLVG